MHIPKGTVPPPCNTCTDTESKFQTPSKSFEKCTKSTIGKPPQIKGHVKMEIDRRQVIKQGFYI